MGREGVFMPYVGISCQNMVSSQCFPVLFSNAFYIGSVSGKPVDNFVEDVRRLTCGYSGCRQCAWLIRVAFPMQDSKILRRPLSAARGLRLAFRGCRRVCVGIAGGYP